LIVLDTSALFSALLPDQPEGDRVRGALEAEPGPFVLSPFVLAELDYLITSRSRRPETGLKLLDDVASGTYELASFEADAVAQAADIIRTYNDLRIGLTDASIVVLAERYRTNRVLTLDERHFRALRTPSGGAFTLVPADA
jgi:predicted nucleic acid-binding protein